ncbi:hypothetical protein BS47DRAFT_1363250 [Hydnum rufescens UP504]|uniref:Uncharacterized protein n=1 Tax=Hydnum rufescens UP504 TaxID=1448309 RepID=A0A9P6DV26_9AGAM|nr:hypothetical protein BS47DRAFT_1363250 [Hydnum rufescens UP504]
MSQSSLRHAHCKGIEVVTLHLGAFWMPAIAGVELCFFPAPYATTQQGTRRPHTRRCECVVTRSHLSHEQIATRNPSSPRYRHQASKNGDDRITTYPNKSPHLKSSTVHGHRVKRGTTHLPWRILNSNLYEPAEPNPATPNPPNERPGNKHPPHERPPNEHPPNENLPYEHHPPAKTDNPPNEHGPNGLRQTKLSKPHTHQSGCVVILGLFPPRRPTRRGHRVPYTRFGGCVVLVVYRDAKRVHFTMQHLTRRMHRSGQGKTRDHAATHTPQSSTSHNIYEDETNTAPHTRFGGYLHCPISDSTNAQTRSKAKHGTAPPPYPRPSIFRNNETRNKYSATHPLRQVICQGHAATGAPNNYKHG